MKRPSLAILSLINGKLRKKNAKKKKNFAEMKNFSYFCIG